MKSQLFWKTFGLYVLLSLLVLIVFLVSLNSRVANQTAEDSQQDGLATLLQIRQNIAGNENPESRISVWQQALHRDGRQLWLLDSEGRPLTRPFDQPPLEMALNSMVRAALESGQSIRQIRFEDDAQEELAIAVDASLDADNRRVLLIVTDADRVQSLSGAAMKAATGSAVVTWLLGIICAGLVAVGIVSPLQTVSQNLAGSADRSQRHDMLLRIADRNDEIGIVAASLHRQEEEHRLTVTDLQQSEREAQSSVELLSTVLDSMVEGVVAIDGEQRMVFLNAAVRPLLGMSDMIGPGHRLYEAVRVPAFLDTVAETLTSRQMQTLEYRSSRDYSDLVLTVIPILKGPHAGAVAVVRDISETRRLDAMRRDFVSGVSHELKTPLTVIQACTDTLLGGAMSDPVAADKFLRQIDEQSERLSKLILGMLELARVESGEQVLHIESIDVHLLADDVIRGFQTVADTRSIRLIRTGAEALTVTSDAQALETILSNLIDNAVKHTPDGGTVTVELISHGATGIVIRDSGSGIPEELLGRIFERFYRVDRDRSRERGGTGLGLAIVKHLCQAIGASVSVKSQLGEGSEFTVRF